MVCRKINKIELIEAGSAGGKYLESLGVSSWREMTKDQWEEFIYIVTQNYELAMDIPF
jgi:hypothetical protein